MSLVIIRGLPGSGKSTLAELLCYSEDYFEYGTPVWAEADQFMTEDGTRNILSDPAKYRFDARKLGYCHARCFQAVEESLKTRGKAIVSNTFTQRWEYEPYIKLAAKYNVPVQIIEVHGNFGSVHNVPEDKMALMRSRWEPHI